MITGFLNYCRNSEGKRFSEELLTDYRLENFRFDPLPKLYKSRSHSVKSAPLGPAHPRQFHCTLDELVRRLIGKLSDLIEYKCGFQPDLHIGSVHRQKLCVDEMGSDGCVVKRSSTPASVVLSFRVLESAFEPETVATISPLGPVF